MPPGIKNIGVPGYEIEPTNWRPNDFDKASLKDPIKSANFKRDLEKLPIARGKRMPMNIAPS